MALALGTNCGFVASSPNADPNETPGTIDGYAVGLKDTTAPSGETYISEIGWYQSGNNTYATAYNCGIYSHDAVNNRPNTLVATQSSGQKLVPSTPGWYKYTGLSISVSSSTTYWVSIGCATDGSGQTVDYAASSGNKYDWKTLPTVALPDPWGASGGTFERICTVYAVAGVAPAGGVTVPQTLMAREHY